MTETHIWAVQCNPASLPELKSSEVGVAYSTNYNAMNMVCSRINAGTTWNTLAYGMSYAIIGNSHFRESDYKLCIAHKLNENNNIAISGNVTRIFQDEYNPSYTISPELAYWGKQKHLTYGLHIVNPLQLFKKNVNKPPLFKISSCYAITNVLQASCLITSTDKYQQQFAIGVCYKLVNKYLFDITFCNNENPIQISIQMPINQFICNYETIYNHYLGFSHTISFIYVIKSNRHNVN